MMQEHHRDAWAMLSRTCAAPQLNEVPIGWGTSSSGQALIGPELRQITARELRALKRRHRIRLPPHQDLSDDCRGEEGEQKNATDIRAMHA